MSEEMVEEEASRRHCHRWRRMVSAFLEESEAGCRCTSAWSRLEKDLLRH